MAQTGKGYGEAASAGGTSLSELHDICKYHGWNDTTTTGLAALTRFINRTLQILCILAPWPEYHKRDGTIAMADTDVDYTLSQKNIQQLGQLVRTTSPTPLKIITGGLDEWLQLNKSSAQSGMPNQYTIRKSVNSSGEIETELLVYPTPADTETLYYSYRILPSKLVELSDIADWPDARLWLLDEALDVRVNSGKKDTTGLALESADFMAKIQRAMLDSRTSYMPVPLEPPSSLRNKTIREVPMQV